jgi:hypothetical protein
MSDTTPILEAGKNEAVLAGRRIPITEPVPESNLARFQPKLTFDDYTRDSDDLISVWVQSSWLGGGQAGILNAQSQGERWWDSTLNTEYPNMLSLRQKVQLLSPPEGVSGIFRPLGDYNDVYYGCWGSTLCSFDGDVWMEVDDLHNVPAAKPAVYDGLLYVPLGANGLDSFDDGGPGVAAVVDGSSDPIPARSVVVWDDKLLVLTTTNKLLIFDGTTWTGGTSALTIKTGEISRQLVYFHDTSGEPAVYVTTSRGLWAYDPVNAKLVKTDVKMPPHPTQARASAVWRNTDISISIGTGVQAWNGDVLNPTGLDRDQGLRAELRGNIVDLEPEYNGLMALVAGAAVSSDTNTLFADNPMSEEVSQTFPNQQSISSLWRYTGFGWHKVWESADASGAPTWSVVGADEAGTRYDLIWGYGERCYRLPLVRDFYNPQQAIRVGEIDFETTGWLRTGRWNGNMPSWPKLLSHLDVNIAENSAGTIRIDYQTEADTNAWTNLGEIVQITPETKTHQYRFYFGPQFVDDDKGRVYDINEGLLFDWIEFRYTLAQPDGESTMTPVVDSFVMKFVKLPLSTYSWTLQVPLTGWDEQFYDMGPNEMADWLSGLAAGGRFVPFTFRGKTHRALVAQSTAQRNSGDSPIGAFTLTVLEVA